MVYLENVEIVCQEKVNRGCKENREDLCQENKENCMLRTYREPLTERIHLYLSICIRESVHFEGKDLEDMVWGIICRRYTERYCI